MLDADYFSVAMHLTMRAKKGVALPPTLPPELIPPKHRPYNQMARLNLD